MTRDIPLSDDRAVSIAVTHVLTIGITTILIAGLLIGAGGLLEEEKSDAARDEMRTIGNRIAVDISNVDHAADGGTGTMSIRSKHVPEVSGAGYTIRLRPSTDADCPYDTACLILEAAATDTTVIVPFRNETPVQSSAVSGGTVYVVYDGSSITLASEPPTLRIAVAPPAAGVAMATPAPLDSRTSARYRPPPGEVIHR
ncbi:DUF7266 family protein [Haloarchaeobius sp. TZWWS8]|uniref:DUF7266 family protein n=1 Tax=Haloarchaeobius sp. TZWWS8 TaxID=3446121 RepID=UPI003EBDCE74